MEAIRSNYNTQEVLDILSIKPYFLRFWESEFEQVDPITSESGQKIYTPKDLIILKKIKHLLSVDQLTIQKAKSLIQKEFEPETIMSRIEDSSEKMPATSSIKDELTHKVETHKTNFLQSADLLLKLEGLKKSILKLKRELV